MSPHLSQKKNAHKNSVFLYFTISGYAHWFKISKMLSYLDFLNGSSNVIKLAKTRFILLDTFKWGHLLFLIQDKPPKKLFEANLCSRKRSVIIYPLGGQN